MLVSTNGDIPDILDMLSILTISDNDEFKLFVYGIMVASSIASVSVVSIYSYFDFSQTPAFVRKYKVNPHTNEPPDYKQFMKVSHNECQFSI